MRSIYIFFLCGVAYASSISAPEIKTGSRLPSVKWLNQDNAVEDLRMISQPRDMDLDKIKDFVYDSKAGEGILVYVVDRGVQINVKNNDGQNEFITETINVDGKDIPNVLQSAESRELGQSPETDDDPSEATHKTHGTLVASKAVCAKYGVAKKATLIPVKITSVFDDMFDAFEPILEDLDPATKPGRAMRAVIVCSMSFGASSTHDSAHADARGKAMKAYIDKTAGLGTPIVTSAGNHGIKRPIIDQLPQVLEDEDTHIINVGAVDFHGKLWPNSQDGDQVTIYAPGTGSESQTKTDKTSMIGSGTSIAAPAVAGLIAVYMSSDQPPWDTNLRGEERVKAIKTFMRSKENDKTAWARPGENMKVIWNGADKAAHKNAGGNTCATNSSRLRRQETCDPKLPAYIVPVCHDFGPNQKHYVEQAMVTRYLDDFCKHIAQYSAQARGSGSISRTYNTGTVEQIDVSMEWQPGRSFEPDESTCKTYMQDILLGDCDKEIKEWASGGDITVDNVMYSWHASNDGVRPIDQFKKVAGCKYKYKFPLPYLSYEVWGAGWESDNFGSELYKNIKGKGISPTKWWFQYQNGNDGREWTATFRTVLGPTEDQVESSMETVGKSGPGGAFDVECHG